MKYALMEALHNGDTNHNGKIEVTELAAHVERRVPELFSELKANGWLIKGVPAAPVRGIGGDAQSAHFGSTGGDFALVNRLPNEMRRTFILAAGSAVAAEASADKCSGAQGISASDGRRGRWYSEQRQGRRGPGLSMFAWLPWACAAVS